ncbi:hypothetical protein RJ640_027953 [Escallonia rubra]|uniref:Peptide deformylase n=1 Tax=Escallonia rubra TaxID=112253 RepID=A0AA88R0Z7_9ASTE|nr:hypothetical protein RJ640_027953 [Escallonia rubra]
MACANWLHSSAIPHAVLPFFYHRSNLLSSNFRRLHRFTSTTRFMSSRSSHQAAAAHAQAKRGFSVKEDEVASPADLYFEAPLNIVEYPDPILRAKNKRIDTFDENLKKLVDEMFNVMYRTDGIGLSAPQVGVNVQLMVFNPVGVRGEGEEIVLVNPRVNKYSKKAVLFNEGCLSFPGIYADVMRPESVKIDAQDISGERFAVDLAELPARVFQHEFDHLQGILFFDRMSEEVLDGIWTELQALEKKYEDKTGLQSPERIDTRQRRKAAAGFGKSRLQTEASLKSSGFE